MPRLFRWIAVAALAIAIAGGVLAHSIGLFARAPVFSTGNGALDGYDVVAFHVDGKAVPGDPDLAVQWRGAQWRFSSAANRAAFERDPERYAPAYGGHCAYAMAGDYTANGDPLAFTVHAGRLYLNFDADTRDAWLAGRDAMIASGDRNWPRSRPAQATPGS